MKDSKRCSGVGSKPDRVDTQDELARCPTCKRWFARIKSGLVRIHVWKDTGARVTLKSNGDGTLTIKARGRGVDLRSLFGAKP